MSPTPSDQPVYHPRRTSQSRFVPVRGLSYHVHLWGDPAAVTPERPALVMVHGWMDVGASFQFLVDELDRLGALPPCVIAPDWRGFGRTQAPPATDAYWFADYLGDLDGLLQALLPGEAPIDLLGHSMGGNVVMIYSGVRPERIRRLVNLEGFGLPRTQPEQAPKRYRQWLDELGQPPELRDYAGPAEVAARLMRNNPRLPAEQAAWLAPHWAAPVGDGPQARWQLQADPAHRKTNPVLYRVEEVLACWQAITAPVLWVEGADTQLSQWWGNRYPREDFDARLAQVPCLQRHTLADCAHMLHHDQPAALAARLASFLAPQAGQTAAPGA
ncbi:MAG: hypothetical protein RL722_1531 [Pseudomonadota bacterium]|jgi:pimeloyl-ACP methyl ester carboxylesterase